MPKCQSADGQTFKSIPVDNRVKAYHGSALYARLVDKLKLGIYSYNESRIRSIMAFPWYIILDIASNFKTTLRQVDYF